MDLASFQYGPLVGRESLKSAANLLLYEKQLLASCWHLSVGPLLEPTFELLLLVDPFQSDQSRLDIDSNVTRAVSKIDFTFDFLQRHA